jgi:hypothetical protein
MEQGSATVKSSEFRRNSSPRIPQFARPGPRTERKRKQGRLPVSERACRARIHFSSGWFSRQIGVPLRTESRVRCRLPRRLGEHEWQPGRMAFTWTPRSSIFGKRPLCKHDATRILVRGDAVKWPINRQLLCHLPLRTWAVHKQMNS